MDFSEHVVISAAGSAAILAGGGGWESAAAFSLCGVFIDLDHFADYWRETGFNLDIPRFMKYFSGRKAKKLLLFMHGWELPSLVIAVSLALGLPTWVFWGTAGWLVHLLLDQRYNYLHPLAYFWAFRLKHGFDAEKFYTD